MGLRKIGQTVEQKDNEKIRGMIQKVRHLVSVKNREELKMKLNQLAPPKVQRRKQQGKVADTDREATRLAAEEPTENSARAAE